MLSTSSFNLATPTPSPPFRPSLKTKFSVSCSNSSELHQTACHGKCVCRMNRPVDRVRSVQVIPVKKQPHQSIQLGVRQISLCINSWEVSSSNPLWIRVRRSHWSHRLMQQLLKRCRFVYKLTGRIQFLFRTISVDESPPLEQLSHAPCPHERQHLAACAPLFQTIFSLLPPRGPRLTNPPILPATAALPKSLQLLFPKCRHLEM